MAAPQHARSPKARSGTIVAAGHSIMGKRGGHVNETIDSDDLMVIAGRVAKVIDNVRPAKVFLDAIGPGAGAYDRLREMKFNQVKGINFAQPPIDDRKWSNKRAEMWGLLGEWLADPAGVDIPD